MALFQQQRALIAQPFKLRPSISGNGGFAVVESQKPRFIVKYGLNGEKNKHLLLVKYWVQEYIGCVCVWGGGGGDLRACVNCLCILFCDFVYLFLVEWRWVFLRVLLLHIMFDNTKDEIVSRFSALCPKTVD